MLDPIVVVRKGQNAIRQMDTYMPGGPHRSVPGLRSFAQSFLQAWSQCLLGVNLLCTPFTAVIRCPTHRFLSHVRNGGVGNMGRIIPSFVQQ
jgi:hypothetical protein